MDTAAKTSTAGSTAQDPTPAVETHKKHKKTKKKTEKKKDEKKEEKGEKQKPKQKKKASVTHFRVGYVVVFQDPIKKSLDRSHFTMVRRDSLLDLPAFVRDNHRMSETERCTTVR